MNKRPFLETPRLNLYPLEESDLPHLAAMLQDARVMTAWEHTFSNAEVRAWAERSRELFASSGFGWFLLRLRDRGDVVGQAALMPDVVNGQPCHEISYMLLHEHWHCGYAREAARALAHYALRERGLPAVIFELRPQNEGSRRVAEALGATLAGSFIKPYRGKGMLHLVYRLTSSEAGA